MSIQLSDHGYCQKSHPKKINKTTRLNESLNISKKLITSVEGRNELLEKYYDEKIKFMQERTEHMRRQTEIGQSVLNILTEMKHLLKECLTKK